MSSWISSRTIRKPIKLPNSSNSTGFIPTFHILIATAGKSYLINMLNSLKGELTINDAITIVFDGEGSLQKSSFRNEWLIGHKSKINIIEQEPNLGYWGHGIRNKYQGILDPKTTFIMNADDDDKYIEGIFNKLRKLCSNPDTLYIANFLVKRTNILVPSQNQKIIKDDIGTPCGIIPYNIADKSIWEHKYGGDFDYYNTLQTFASQMIFLNLTIYIV